MQQRVHSRLALRVLPKLRLCAEGGIAREWTCWKPRNKTHDRIASNRPPTIQWTMCSMPWGRTAGLHALMPFPPSAR